MYILLALVVGLASILKVAGVLDSNGLAANRLSTGALLVSSLGDAHGE